MKLLSKACCGSFSSCPGVSDPEDGTDELIIVGRNGLGVEVTIRIARDLIEQAVAELQTQS